MQAQLSTVPDGVLDNWITELRRYDDACGCKSGAATMMVTVALWPMVALRRRSVSSVREATGALGSLTGATLAGAVAGKVGGLAMSAAARWRLVRKIRTSAGAAPS